jgi:hypothetical protein
MGVPSLVCPIFLKVDERIRARLGHIWVFAKVIGGIEKRIGFPSFARPVLQKVNQRIDP